MNRLFKRTSTSGWSYYSYLNKYEGQFIRKYQSEENFFLGRKSAWKNLVLKYAGDHINLEEEHNFKYKTHMVFVNLSYRVAWMLFVYFTIYWTFFLGDVGKYFNMGDWDYVINPTSDLDNPIRYESLYVRIKDQKY